jgi:hypothetical protein
LLTRGICAFQSLTLYNPVLEGANPSAEGDDADEGGEGGETQRVLDIEDQFRLNKIEGKPSKKGFQSEIKSKTVPKSLYSASLLTKCQLTVYCKKVLDKLKESGKTEEAKAFQAAAPGAVKKILGNYDNYDLYMGESMEEGSMYVLVDFREDGVTPYATVWKYGLEEYKV